MKQKDSSGAQAAKQWFPISGYHNSGRTHSHVSELAQF